MQRLFQAVDLHRAVVTGDRLPVMERRDFEDGRHRERRLRHVGADDAEGRARAREFDFQVFEELGHADLVVARSEEQTGAGLPARDVEGAALLYAPPFIGLHMKFSWIWGPTHFREKRDFAIAMKGPALK